MAVSEAFPRVFASDNKKPIPVAAGDGFWLGVPEAV
jgi:hypothetical protein